MASRRRVIQRYDPMYCRLPLEKENGDDLSSTDDDKDTDGGNGNGDGHVHDDEDNAQRPPSVTHTGMSSRTLPKWLVRRIMYARHLQTNKTTADTMTQEEYIAFTFYVQVYVTVPDDIAVGVRAGFNERSEDSLWQWNDHTHQWTMIESHDPDSLLLSSAEHKILQLQQMVVRKYAKQIYGDDRGSRPAPESSFTAPPKDASRLDDESCDGNLAVMPSHAPSSPSSLSSSSSTSTASVLDTTGANSLSSTSTPTAEADDDHDNGHEDDDTMNRKSPGDKDILDSADVVTESKSILKSSRGAAGGATPAGFVSTRSATNGRFPHHVRSKSTPTTELSRTSTPHVHRRGPAVTHSVLSSSRAENRQQRGSSSRATSARAKPGPGPSNTHRMKRPRMDEDTAVNLACDDGSVASSPSTTGSSWRKMIEATYDTAASAVDRAARWSSKPKNGIPLLVTSVTVLALLLYLDEQQAQRRHKQVRQHDDSVASPLYYSRPLYYP